MRRGKYEKILFFLSFVLFFFGTFFTVEANCDARYLLTGRNQTLVDQQNSYALIGSGSEGTGTDEVIFSLDGKKLAKNSSTLDHRFEKTGTYTLKVAFKDQECEGELEKTIEVYDKQILYLGKNSDFLHFGFEEQLNKVGYLFMPIFGDKSERALGGIQTIPFLSSDLIIIDDKEIQAFIKQYLASKEGTEIPLTKEIVIVTDFNKNLLKRTLSQYATALKDDTVTIISPANLMNLLSDLSLGKEYKNQYYSTQFSWDFKDTSKWMFVSYLVDELLKTGFPIQLLGLLLSFSVVVLCISFFRQVIGLGVFGVYWPLLSALSMSVIGVEEGFFFFFVALFSIGLVRIFTSRFYLLQSSRISLLVAVYLLLSLVGFFVARKVGWIFDHYVSLSLSFVFPFVIILLVVDKAFVNFNFRTKKWWIRFLEFGVISAIAYGLFHWEGLTNFLLSYPEFLLLSLLLTLVIGRFSGLQFFELIRFMPLIRRHLDEEEE